MAFRCPTCKKPLGSGGKRKRRESLLKPLAKSSSIICSIKCKDAFSSDIKSFLQRYLKRESRPREFVTSLYIYTKKEWVLFALEILRYTRTMVA